MKQRNDRIVLSASDLANHLACGHLTQLELRRLNGEIKKPIRHDPVLKTLIERGIEHERQYVEFLQADESVVVQVAADRETARSVKVDQTIEAMNAGADVIAQAALGDGQWQGYADLLLKTDRSSDLGDWSYEVGDTKLARNTRAGTVLQLCLYSDLVGQIQGLPPRRMFVIKPGEPFEVEELLFNDFSAYYRLIKSRLEQTVAAGTGEATYPNPVNHCDVCSWWPACNQRRRDDDHLTFVAGIGRQQIEELADQSITTLVQLATVNDLAKPNRGSLDSLKRVQQQARIQHEGNTAGKPVHELLPVEPARGFNRLPKPDAADVFFDIEGDPHAPGGGLEYLLGYVTNDNDTPEFHSIWALSHKQEKQAFEQFIDYIIDRWASSPGMHVYHYAPYEPSAMKRLATRHATREDEVDRLLRAEKFIDLYGVVRQGVRASVESYSIKRLEPFYDYERLEELDSARHALHRLERAIELGLPEEVLDDDREVVRVYNKDDCLSTLALRDWLESLRAELVQQSKPVTRPPLKDGEPPATNVEQNNVIDQLATQLVELCDEEHTTEADEAQWLLAHLLPYFRREDKCRWWEFFRLRDLEPDDLYSERSAIAGLLFVKEVQPTGRQRTVRHRYRFPEQEFSVEADDVLYEIGGEKIGVVSAIAGQQVDVRLVADVDHHPATVFTHKVIPTDKLQQSLISFASSMIDAARKTESPRSARYDLLCSRAPRLKTLTLPQPGDDSIDEATQLSFDLDASLLAIQGPPGAGKTYVGSRVIAALAKAGKKVGITAVSHKVIRNLLTTIRDAPEAKGVQLAHRYGQSTRFHKGIEFVGNTTDATKAIDEGKVLGGTAWLWCENQMDQKLDYLFVDEAGQMSLAMVLAAGRAAKNIILLGDPQQLEQPQQASHPEGAEVAALKHVIGDNETIPDVKGLFLDETWRMHPSICQFNSECYYDGRLTSRPELAKQSIVGPSVFAGSGLMYVPVNHTGNQARSNEEVVEVERIVDELLAGHSWIDADGKTLSISSRDILIVAPYNAQVSALKAAIGDKSRVGTVDKFQGQEAPIVIYSMTSSSVEDAPRGMEFLLSPNRLNVATSRARCRVILIGSSSLFAAECKSVSQMQKANGLCRYSELT